MKKSRLDFNREDYSIFLLENIKKTVFIKKNRKKKYSFNLYFNYQLCHFKKCIFMIKY